MNYVEPVRDPLIVRDIGEYLGRTNGEKYRILWMIGIYSGLRVSDILKLRIEDVRGKKQITMREKKTGKRRSFPINEAIRPDLEVYCKGRYGSNYLIPGKNKGKPVSRQYAYRVIRQAGEYFGIQGLGTHSMRKTFGYHFYRQTGDIVLLMKILNHSDQAKTLRYIGIEQTSINRAMMDFNYRVRDYAEI